MCGTPGMSQMALMPVMRCDVTKALELRWGLAVGLSGFAWHQPVAAAGLGRNVRAPGKWGMRTYDSWVLLSRCHDLEHLIKTNVIMRKLDIAALCFGVFLFVALTTSKAGLLIDDFSYPGSSVPCHVSGTTGFYDDLQNIPSGTMAGTRVAVVEIAVSSGSVGTASTDIGGGVASFSNTGSGSGTTTHQIVWYPTIPFNIVTLSGSADTLGFVLDVVSANASSLFIITVREDLKWAEYRATVSGAGEAYFSFYRASTDRPGLAKNIWFNPDAKTLPYGSSVSFVFDGLTAVSTVPEPTNVALGLFGALALTVGGVRMGRRLMTARRTG